MDAGRPSRAGLLVQPADGGATLKSWWTRQPLDALGPRVQARTAPARLAPPGRVSPAEFEAAVEAVLERIERCHGQALTRDRPDTGGVLVVDFTLGAKGTVVAASSTVREGVFSKELRGCVVSAMERVEVRAPGAPVRVRYPLTFVRP